LKVRRDEAIVPIFIDSGAPLYSQNDLPRMRVRGCATDPLLAALLGPEQQANLRAGHITPVQTRA
jgi:hypothetical protein